MNESVIPTVVEQMLVLPDDMQRQVLAYLQDLRATYIEAHLESN